MTDRILGLFICARETLNQGPRMTQFNAQMNTMQRKI